MPPEHLQQIIGFYLEDARKHLQVIEQHLLNLQRTIENPEKFSELFGAARCGILGGVSLLPISSSHISSIHKTGFCLVDCLKVFQHEGSVKVDQKLQDLLMQVFYALKDLIEQLNEPYSLKDERAAQVMSEVELIKEAFIEHLKVLVKRSHSANQPEVASAPDSADDIPSLEDLQSLIDELLLDGSSTNSAPSSQQDK
jgi:chemosensory pili system protein ChpA (sensor histidine kinase/response regulator)